MRLHSSTLENVRWRDSSFIPLLLTSCNLFETAEICPQMEARYHVCAIRIRAFHLFRPIDITLVTILSLDKCFLIIRSV
jgi:hypothetical protein